MIEEINIERLPKKFVGTGEVKGFEFTELKRSDTTLLFEVRYHDLTYFEVFPIRTTEKCIDFAKRLYSETDFKEVYPKAYQFGEWGHTYRVYRKALEKFEELDGLQRA
jgi:hypothetical protein